jgi:hypothetical protein
VVVEGRKCYNSMSVVDSRFLGVCRQVRINSAASSSAGDSPRHTAAPYGSFMPPPSSSQRRRARFVVLHSKPRQLAVSCTLAAVQAT